MNISKERVEFEDWLERVHLLTATWNESRNCYDEFPAHLAFKAWLASRERMNEVVLFIDDVSKQTPEKPDYWSSCGQCSRNTDRAEDLLENLK